MCCSMVLAILCATYVHLWGLHWIHGHSAKCDCLKHENGNISGTIVKDGFSLWKKTGKTLSLIPTPQHPWSLPQEYGEKIYSVVFQFRNGIWLTSTLLFRLLHNASDVAVRRKSLKLRRVCDRNVVLTKHLPNTHIHTGCGKIKYPVNFFAYFSATAWNLNAKFCTHV